MKRTFPVLAALICACSPQGPAATPVASPSAAPSTVVQATPSAAATTAASSPAASPASPASPAGGPVHGLVAVASSSAGVMAGADVQVYRLGQAQAFATGKAGTNGGFQVNLGAGFPLGAPVQLVVSKDGRTVVSVGFAGIVASGAGNIVATGGGNIVASGAGNFNAAGIVASGAGNWALLDTPASPDPAVQQIGTADALAWAILGPRFVGAGQATTLPGGDVLLSDVANLRLAFQTLLDASKGVVAGIATPDFEHPSSEPGHPRATSLPTSITNDPTLRTAFQRASTLAADAITGGLAHGGTQPSPDTLERIDFGGLSADVIDPGAVGTQPGEQGARDEPANDNV